MDQIGDGFLTNVLSRQCRGSYPGFALLSHLLIAGCDIGVQTSVRSSVTFTSKFDIYVKVFVFPALVIGVIVKPCIVIVLDIPFKHTP